MNGPYGGQNQPPWIGVLVFGIFLTFGGVMFLAFGASMISDDPYDPFYGFDREASRTPMMMGAVMLLFGLILIVVAIWMHKAGIGEGSSAVAQIPQPPPSTEYHVVREVIKVRCRYCSTLNDVNAKACTSCGGVL